MENISLGQHFTKYFNVLIADTPELKQEVFKIRYKVYCEELGYEPLDRFPDKLEKDAYDARSVHCLLQHKPTGIYAGCVRLILSDAENSQAKFPFEYICPNHSMDFDNSIPRHCVAEVSRLAVISQFRKRSGEESSPSGLILFDEKKKEKEQETITQKRRSPVIALSLYLAATVLVVDLQLEYALTLMEPRLARHLRMTGLKFTSIGEKIDFHGKRGPFSIKIPGLVDKLHKNDDVYGLFETIYSFIGKHNSLSIYQTYHRVC